MTVDDVDLASLIPEGEEYVTARVQVSALGINADRHADDDVSRSVSFTVARDPGAVPTPEPEPDPGEGSGVVPVDPVPPGIMSVPRTSAQMPQNYAVNLAADADDATFQRALYQASLLGGMGVGVLPGFAHVLRPVLVGCFRDGPGVRAGGFRYFLPFGGSDPSGSRRGQ